mmetsp:Transcript_35953/g.101180  ORF Transcript_35953/g.101180 Transcript_35953/m.101180 type:complete len:138 (-) Transcript_35953:1004-1417(-)
MYARARDPGNLLLAAGSALVFGATTSESEEYPRTPASLWSSGPAARRVSATGIECERWRAMGGGSPAGVLGHLPGLISSCRSPRGEWGVPSLRPSGPRRRIHLRLLQKWVTPGWAAPEGNLVITASLEHIQGKKSMA